MDGLESALWYGSLAVLGGALADHAFGVLLHPIVRYALGATALVVLLFFMEADDDDEVVVETNIKNALGGGGGTASKVGEVSGSREAKREQLKEEIRTKILHDASRAADVEPPSKAEKAEKADDGAAKPDKERADSGEESEKEGEASADADNGSSNSNTWRCACENGFLPPGLLKNFGGAEAVMRMGMGQCYHKNGV